jgi:L-lactate dehydrogenase complex protein LldF
MITDHPTLAAEFVANQERAHWHDQALWFVRVKHLVLSRECHVQYAD